MKTSEKALAGATGAVIFLALGWTQVGKPVLDDWTDARSRVEKLQDQIGRAQALIRTKREVETEHAAIQGALAPPEDHDPGATGQIAQSVAFLAHLSELTDAAGFKPTSLRYVRADPYDAFAELRYELKARAPLKQIEDFLVRMTASQWYLRVQALQFIPREDGTVEADVSLVALATRDALEPTEERRPAGGERPK